MIHLSRYHLSFIGVRTLKKHDWITNHSADHDQTSRWARWAGRSRSALIAKVYTFPPAGKGLILNWSWINFNILFIWIWIKPTKLILTVSVSSLTAAVKSCSRGFWFNVWLWHSARQCYEYLMCKLIRIYINWQY